MLEFFRKHKGAFLITLTVIIIISFSVWGGWKGKDQMTGGTTIFTIYGKDYSKAEFDRLRRSTQLLYMLQMFELFGLGDIARDPEAQGQDFLFNLLVLRHELTESGIYASDAEAQEELKKLNALQENGVFSPQRAKTVEENLGMMGMSGQDMLDMVKLKIGFNKLQELTNRNYVPSPLAVEKDYARQHQTLKISTIPFLLDDFKKNVKITDEDIQKYYDETKESYMTAEKRAVSYVFFEDPKDLDKKPSEERQKIEKEARDRVNKFTDKTVDPGAELVKIAAEQNIPVQTLPLFARTEAPEAIKAERELIQAIFQFDKSQRTISDAVKGSKGFYVFTVTNIEEPKQQELVAVKDKVKEALTTQKAREAMSKAVNDARTALVDGLKAGKKIEDLTKEKKLTLTPMKELEVSQPASDIPDAHAIAAQAKDTAAGAVTPVIETDTGATLVYVHAKELRKRDDSKDLRKNTEDTIRTTDQDRIFEAWFTKKRQAAGLKFAQ